MKKLVILQLLFILFVQCKVEQIKKNVIIEKSKPDPIVVKSLNDFFLRSEYDITNAKKVIVDNDIIKNLTHLQNMDAAGKYYLLERENISKMINAVTKGVYSDYILINKSGKIIYTRTNNDIFGKNVRSHLKNSPLSVCYDNRNIDIFFHDISSLSETSECCFFFISIKVKGGISFPGIFILQVDSSKLKELLKKDTEIIGYDGIYRIANRYTDYKTQYKYFNKINIDNAKNRDNMYDFVIPDVGKIMYQFFEYKDIKWILINP